MSIVARIVVVTGALMGFALAANGCVDTSAVPPTNEVDAALPPPPGLDGGEDAALVDSSVDASTDTGAVDAGKKAAPSPTQLGLVAGGVVSHSPSYTMSGTTGPATAPVLRSPHYQLVGGMTVSTQKN